MGSPKTVRVDYQGSITIIPDVYLGEYGVKNLYFDVLKMSKKSSTPIPKHPGFFWHPPIVTKLRCPMETDQDWVRLTTEWEKYKFSNVIPIIMVSRSKPSLVELGVQSFKDWMEKNEVKEDESYVSSSQPTLSQANIWADQLILSQPFMYCEPQAHESVVEEDSVKKLKLVVRSKNKKTIASRSPQKQTGLELNDLVDWEPESQPDIPTWDVFVDPDPIVETIAANSGAVLETILETVENDGIGREGVDGDEDGEEDGENESSDDSELSDQDGLEIEAITKQRMAFSCDQKKDGGAPHSVAAMSNVYKQGRIWTRASDGRVYLKKHDMFTCKSDLVSAMKDFSIQEGFRLKKIKHEKNRYTMKCSDPKCTWRFHASTLAEKVTWMVRSHKGTHRCSKGEKHNMVGKRWLAAHMLPLYRADPGKMTVQTIVSHMWSRFGIPVDNWMCRRALGIMKICVNGSHAEGYSLLPQYCEQFLVKNPTSVTLVNWIDQEIPRNPTFKRITICIGPAVESFKAHCRPLIGIDACHLKGPFKGVLMTAIGLDGNNGQFPLAYGVAGIENDEEWALFLSCLAKALDAQTDNARYTFMSDRHKGIISSIKKVFPQAKRRICVLHLYKNFAVNNPGAWFHDMFYTVANAYSDVVFNKGMEMIKFKKAEAYRYLMSETLSHWCRHKFAMSLKSSDNTNNFVESFNGVIVKYRGKPCLTMLESIRKVIGARFNTRYQTSLKCNEVVTPFVKKKLEQLEEDSKLVHTTVNMGRQVFEATEGSTTFIVKLGEGYCDCQKWQITGLPCKHAVRCIRILKLELFDFCDPYFKVDKYMQLYDNIVNPIPDPKFWPQSDLPKLDPPFGLRKLGRPELHHRKDGHDWVKTVKNPTGIKICKGCGKMGHNKTTCNKPRDEDGNVIKHAGQKRKKPMVNEDGTRRKRGRPNTKGATSRGTSTQATSTQGSCLEVVGSQQVEN